MRLNLYGVNTNHSELAEMISAIPEHIRIEDDSNRNSFLKGLSGSPPDGIVVATDRADGMEGVIAAKTLCRDIPVLWFSDDGGGMALSAVFYLSLPAAKTPDDYLTTLRATTRLTVQDSVGGGKIVQPNGVPAVIATFNSTLTVNSGTIEDISSEDHDDGQFHMAPNCAVLLSGGGKAVINGGTLSGMCGVAVTGYITKEETEFIKQVYGVEYSNELYGNELTIADGEIKSTSGHALIVYEKAKKIELSGGTFSSNN